MTRQESQTIDVLRLPMALAVVCVHAVSYFPNVEVPVMSFGIPESWCDYVYCLLTKRLVCLALPFFFLISGFLLFQRMDQWDWKTFSNKLKRRIFTLLLPYFCWNFLMILNFAFRCVIKEPNVSSAWQAFMDLYDKNGGFLHMMWDCFVLNVDREDWLGFANPSYLPVHMPMWFVRDLIVLSCLTPLLYWPLKHWPKLSVLALMFCLISGVWIHFPGFSSFSASYFCFGALLSIHRLSLFPVKTWAVVTLLLLGVFSMVYLLSPLVDNGEKWFGLLACSSVVFGLFAIMGLTGRIIGDKVLNLPSWLGQASFFIFSLHTLPIFLYFSPVQISAHISMKMISADTGFGVLFGFLFTLVLTFCICMTFFFIMKRFCPKMLSVLTGKRIIANKL